MELDKKIIIGDEILTFFPTINQRISVKSGEFKGVWKVKNILHRCDREGADFELILTDENLT